jgi:hypothetical protein
MADDIGILPVAHDADFQVMADECLEREAPGFCIVTTPRAAAMG